jgi:hypothetical protein
MPIPRGLVLAAVVLAVVAFSATVGLRPPIQPTTTAYAPGVRSFVAILAFAMVVLWPTWRLLAERATWTRGRALLDAVTLCVAFQAAYWPLHLVTGWPIGRAVAIDATITGWTMAAGAAVALGGARHPVLASLAWMGASLTGVALDALGVWPVAANALGPFVPLLWLTAPESTVGRSLDPAVAGWPWTLAMLGWAGATVSQRRTGLPNAHDSANLS